MLKRHSLLWTALLAAAVTFGCGGKGHEGESEDAHAGHDHEAESHQEEGHEAEGHGGEVHEGEGHEGEGHEGEAHEGEGSEGEHADEIEVTPEAARLARITLSTATAGMIRATIELSGEIGFNEDRLVHITPRFAGIAREARCRVGDYVRAGQVVAVIESNESLTQYTLTAPISGTIIQKHITPGEHASEEMSVFLLADLSTVWANLAVYPRDADWVKAGQKVTVAEVGGGETVAATVEYVTPVIDPQTRRMTARVVLPNTAHRWRPGSFVHGRIEAAGADSGLVVDRAAVQVLGEKQVVFISDEPNRYRPVEVVTGASDQQSIRILSGLDEGMSYVSRGGFELKAKIVTSSLGAHAGHGH